MTYKHILSDLQKTRGYLKHIEGDIMDIDHKLTKKELIKIYSLASKTHLTLLKLIDIFWKKI